MRHVTPERTRAAEEAIAAHLTADPDLPCCHGRTWHGCYTLTLRRAYLPPGHAWGHAAEAARAHTGAGPR